MPTPMPRTTPAAATSTDQQPHHPPMQRVNRRGDLLHGSDRLRFAVSPSSTAPTSRVGLSLDVRGVSHVLLSSRCSLIRMLLGTLNIGLSRSGRHPTLLPSSNLAHCLPPAIRETSERNAVKHAPGVQTQVVTLGDMRGSSRDAVPDLSAFFGLIEERDTVGRVHRVFSLSNPGSSRRMLGDRSGPEYVCGRTVLSMIRCRSWKCSNAVAWPASG